ncbi:hypothetical protein HMPREF0281_00370 [Corynebacterium ammoniagenes DSM 20306]|uniref:Uncharacterized protein n=1 Tax=Corynebacterium ammoniagenes DSM 20306 TaxID=649754 RepID=A0ABN0AHK6_CORAM|nr:hypothetical protein HMPREF0281_00370 [Corynebacterium ammoniagenes DSM 20306]
MLPMFYRCPINACEAVSARLQTATVAAVPNMAKQLYVRINP